MTSTISNWYHNQYSTWNRTRRIQATPYLARVESPASRATRTAAGGAPAPGDAVINLGDLVSPLSPPNAQTAADKKKQDTLFGPSIGIVNPGPEWTDPNKIEQGEKAPIQDVLTPELVQSWVEKSKEASQPTTTLQALVNLKRPSLRLSPIAKDEHEEGAPHTQHHGLEFQFDCDAPKCGISVQVISATDTGTSSSLTEVYHTVADGGFGRMLKFEDGAALELDKFDPSVQATVTSSAQTQPTPEKSADSAAAGEAATSAPASTPVASSDNSQAKKRFKLRIRRRTNAHVNEDANFSVAGPALQVVDDEAPAEGAGSQDKSTKESGVKVLIKLEALDANEHSLASNNSQTTYLHVFRLGSTPAPDVPDTRAWVVRVVKREATIGFHTFHLHEIYGLSSHASPPETPEHSYPPTAADADEPTTECLLCLSNPREVVLLPCRHLVACKECAINMIEYGAGGQLVHTEEAPAEPSTVVPGETPGEGSGAARNTEGGGGGGAEGAALPSPVPPSRPAVPRRKRKAKGWFCPVCRQPYTSLLRISTTAPRKPPHESGDAAPTTAAAAAAAETPGPAAAAAAAAAVAAAAAQNTRSGPGFLRAISNAAARVTGSDNNNNHNNSSNAVPPPPTGEAAV